MHLLVSLWYYYFADDKNCFEKMPLWYCELFPIISYIEWCWFLCFLFVSAYIICLLLNIFCSFSSHTQNVIFFFIIWIKKFLASIFSLWIFCSLLLFVQSIFVWFFFVSLCLLIEKWIWKILKTISSLSNYKRKHCKKNTTKYTKLFTNFSFFSSLPVSRLILT